MNADTIFLASLKPYLPDNDLFDNVYIPVISFLIER